MPNLSACWRRAPGVRFISFAIFATGVLALECLRNSACIALVQAAGRFVFFAALRMNYSNSLRLLSRSAGPMLFPTAHCVHWFRLEVVIKVTYLTCTEDDLLRQASYQGQREDKPANQV